MRKIRYYLMLITLLASLSGFTFLGSGSLANTASSHHVSAVSASSVARFFRPPCGTGGGYDC